ncbi:TetR/AcrR family transcriptional regulator [Kutzneria kofuensis]|uniref:AcrR family transcriptional regulator n=1 Tax=Kutzneria kofuensis TaxID=103725 RepID=A0A7W9KKQ1_9PSEU|nr:TetR/AcrR family transcriptional regulator [Kutzneria kofuensis]MBB5894315.1 AcrR family transcriptional regulator [Kutzneria kofuensis]
MAGKRRTKDDWVAAALEMIAERGVSALAVEPLAQRLGATKGSAYWHFPSREALLSAALDQWTGSISDGLGAFAAVDRPPDEQLWLVFSRVVVDRVDNDLEFAMLAAADDPLVAQAMRCLTEVRLSFLCGRFVALGFAEPVARERALQMHTFLLGHVQIVRRGAEIGDLVEYARGVYRLLTAP